MYRANRYLSALIIAMGSTGVGSTASADAMTPWSGASASAQVFVPASDATTQTGATASASSSKTQDASYYNSSGLRGSTIFTVPVKGSADAQATGNAYGLLHLDATYSTGNPGSSPAILSSVPVAASATWSNDQALVTAAPGGIVPHELRLNFSVTFYGDASSSSAGSLGGLTITANGRTASINPSNNTASWDSNPFAFAFNPGGLGFDSSSSHHLYSYGPYANEATFHIDLPIGATGLSDPFSVGLSAATLSGLKANDIVFSDINDATLSLTSITTTDGTPLSDLGDTASFASGMLAPGAQEMPVPEPSSAVAGIAAAGWFRSGRRRRTMIAGTSRAE